MSRPRILFLICALVLTGSEARAQIGRERYMLVLNAGVETATPALSDRFEFDRFVETASVDVDYRRGTDLLLDAGLHVLLRRHVGVAVSAAHSWKTTAAGVKGRIPHPFFDGQFREIEGVADDLAKKETGVHAGVSYRFDRRAMRALISGGPSYFRAERRIVTGVQYAEAYPFDTATFTGAETFRKTGSALGFHVAGDVVWMPRRRIGLGTTVRFARASIDLDAPDRRAIEIHAGGLQVAGGLRIGF